MEEKEFVETVKNKAFQGWEKTKNGKSKEDGLIWMLCYFTAEEFHESNMIKDWAEMIRDGIPAMNTLEKGQSRN